MIETGRMIKCFRKEKNIKIKYLCEGLCTPAFMSQIESGEKEPDALLFEYIMERIGVSPEDFAIMVTEEEYDYFVWRQEIYDSIEAKDWDRLELLLMEYGTFGSVCNADIGLQFYYYIRGVLEARLENWEMATRYICLAVVQTNPKIFETLESRGVLGVRELHLLMLYLFYGMLAGIFDKTAGKKLFYKLEEYILEGRMETQEQAKLYPKLVCMMIHMLEDEMCLEEKMQKCERAIVLLRMTRRFYDVTELLRLYVPLLKENHGESISFYEKHYEVFCDLFEQGNADTSFRPECMVLRKTKLYLIKEYLCSKRKEKNWTHEKLSENIYDVASYSRVERGKTKPFPRKLKALTEKLDIPWCRYRGELETDHIEVYRLRKQSREAALIGRWEVCLEILEKMETLLDVNNEINYQYIKAKKTFSMYNLNRVSERTTYQEMIKLLELTRKINEDATYLVYYSQTELEIVTCMGQMLGKMKRYEEGILLLELVLKQMCRSMIGVEYQWNGVDVALRVLSGLYFKNEEYEKSIRIVKYVLVENIKIRDGGNLPTILDDIADDLEHMGKQYSDEYRKLYRQTYYVADFFGIEDIKPFAKEYYEVNFEYDYKWY